MAFVDSDDYQSLNTYEELYHQAESGDYDVVYGGAFWNKSNGEFFELFKIDRRFKGKEVLTLLGDMLYQDGNRPFEEQVSMSVWTGIYKLDVINKTIYLSSLNAFTFQRMLFSHGALAFM